MLALALLTLAYVPSPPSLVGLEEIDRGLHPRLLRHLQDALYRLSYPQSVAENRPPIQVIATTHSPYLLDLYREHPDEIVIAEKKDLNVQMRRLTDIARLRGYPGRIAVERGLVQRCPRWRFGGTMRIGYYCESPADRAALSILSHALLDQPPEPINMDLEAHSVPGFFTRARWCIPGCAL